MKRGCCCRFIGDRWQLCKVCRGRALDAAGRLHDRGVLAEVMHATVPSGRSDLFGAALGRSHDREVVRARYALVRAAADRLKTTHSTEEIAALLGFDSTIVARARRAA